LIGEVAARDPDCGGQPPRDQLIRSRPPVPVREHRDRISDRLELPADGADSGSHRRGSMIKPFDRTVAAHLGHSHADEEGSEQDRTEHHRQEGCSESAAQCHISSWDWPALERC
jgi:hypothetical protein